MAAVTQESKNGKTFLEVYELDEELGRGAFSVVKVGHHKESKESYAIKIITKAEMYDFDKKCLENELLVMQELLPPHEHLVRLYDVFDEAEYVHLVLEKVNGGELLDRLIHKTKYTECEARDVCKVVFEAMRHCHEHQVAHRDIKPENLLLASETDDSTVKIADFGFAKKCPADDSLQTQCGSAMHVGPEILKKEKYGTKIDCWALGVVVYTIIGGCPPFYANDNQSIFKQILKGDYDFDDAEMWGHITQDCMDMIKGLLTMDQKERWSTQQVLDCAWMSDDPAMLRRHSLTPNLIKLREFNARSKFKSVVHALKFAKSLPSFCEDKASEPSRDSIVHNPSQGAIVGMDDELRALAKSMEDEELRI